MNKNFEPVVLESYAELCVRWRMAHVEKRVQAEDYDSQLKSLEAVIKAFGLNMPGSKPGNSKRPQSNSKPAATPAKSTDAQPAMSRASGGVMLGD